MEKLKLHTPNLTADNIANVAALFPNCVAETRDEAGKLTRAIDFDQLRQELSDHIVDGPQERYHLDWPGKREALLASNAPIAKTLRPSREESVEFDTTKNLFIEGDNLDALKLLQETYLGAIKMIYIDPPYNTGNQFIYNDRFTETTAEYFERSKQIDEDRNRMVANTEATGKRHSNWLSLMSSRLRLAKNLLANDGVIFISIDTSEEANLRKVCDEILGYDNYVGTVVWKNVTDNNPTNIATEHECVQVYARSKETLERVWKTKLSDVKDVLVKIGERLNAEHSKIEDVRAAYAKWFRENKTFLGPLDRYKYIDAGGVYTGSQSVHNPGKEGYRYDIIHPVTKKACKEPLMGYRFPKSTMDEMLASGEILFGDDEDKIIELKVYAKDYEDKLSSVFELDGRLGPYDLKELFPEIKKVFTNPKPVALIERFASFAVGRDGIILDFFAGSGTTAQAVMSLNAKDGGSRRFILVQLAEEPDPKSDAARAGYKTLADVCKERIRRAGKQVSGSSRPDQPAQSSLFQSEAPPETVASLDTGFRVLKIDTSNMKDVYYAPDEVKQDDLVAHTDNIKEDRTPEDLLFQVLVDSQNDHRPDRNAAEGRSHSAAERVGRERSEDGAVHPPAHKLGESVPWARVRRPWHSLPRRSRIRAWWSRSGVTASGVFASMPRMSFCHANCPLCGRENECQFATNSAYKGKCWCASENFSPDLLARIPDEARNVVCVCRRCVVAANFAEAKARPLPRPIGALLRRASGLTSSGSSVTRELAKPSKEEIANERD